MSNKTQRKFISSLIRMDVRHVASYAVSRDNRRVVRDVAEAVATQFLGFVLIREQILNEIRELPK